MKNQESKRTIDMSQLYAGIEGVASNEFVQLDSGYERHSKFMQGLIDKTVAMVENNGENEQAEAEDKKYGLNATPEERKKIDLDKIEETENVLKDTENVQISSKRGYEKHHQQFLDEVDK